MGGGAAFNGDVVGEKSGLGGFDRKKLWRDGGEACVRVPSTSKEGAVGAKIR